MTDEEKLEETDRKTPCGDERWLEEIRKRDEAAYAVNDRHWLLGYIDRINEQDVEFARNMGTRIGEKEAEIDRLQQRIERAEKLADDWTEESHQQQDRAEKLQQRIAGLKRERDAQTDLMQTQVEAKNHAWDSARTETATAILRRIQLMMPTEVLRENDPEGTYEAVAEALGEIKDICREHGAKG